MLRVGGSLTDIQYRPPASHTMSGGALMGDIMNGMNKMSTESEVVPKVEIPDNTITEEIIPDKETTNAIIEQARNIDGSSFSLSAILNAIIAYTAKVLFVGFEIENKTLHNGLLAIVWLGVAVIIFAVASGISNTNITFIMYCSAMWIIALAILFVIIQPYRISE